MLNYPKKEGKTGTIYQVAEGLYVTQNEWGSWLVVFKRGAERRKKAFGKGEENLNQAIKAAELLAAKLGLTLEKQEETDKTFGKMAKEWFKLNSGR